MQTPIWQRTATRTTITSCFKQPTRALISLNLRLNPFPCDPHQLNSNIFQSKKKRKSSPLLKEQGKIKCNLMICLVIKALFVQHQGEGSTCIALGNRFKDQLRNCLLKQEKYFIRIIYFAEKYVYGIGPCFSYQEELEF